MDRKKREEEEEEEEELLSKSSKKKEDSKEKEGPDNTAFYIAICLIVIPGVLQIVFVAPILWVKFSSIPVLFFLYLFIGTLVMLWLTHSVDPGIIPKRPPTHQKEETTSTSGKNSKRDRYYDKEEVPPREITINGIKMKQRWCSTCNIWRPPRASHCHDCNYCVENFDHHCPWVGNCVAKRNYRFFLLFLLMTTLLCVYTFCCCLGTLYLLSLESDSTSKNVALDVAIQSPISVALAVYTFLLVWSVGGLGCFHMYLVSTGQSTHEEFTARRNPYFFGACNNWLLTCCPPALPSYTRNNNAACIV